MQKQLSLTLLVSVALFSACNRAVPEKTEAKSGESSAGETGGSEPSAGVLASKKSAEGQPVLPPEGASIPISGSQRSSTAPNLASDSTATRNGPPPPGVQIENVTSIAPNGDAAADVPIDERLADRSFMKLQLPDARFVARSIVDLFDGMRSRGARVGDRPRTAQRAALSRASQALEQYEIAASERLSADGSATAAQKKTSIAAQVESLSQLTGLGDVDAAQKLLKVAGELAKSPDVQLAHQGRLVLMGFNLNQLVEGQVKDPQVIVNGVNNLLDKSEYRGLVELLALQQSLGVLNQLGYAEQAKQVQDRVVREFRNSTDKEVAMRSWMIEVGTSPELKASFEGIQNTLAGTETILPRLRLWPRISLGPIPVSIRSPIFLK